METFDLHLAQFGGSAEADDLANSINAVNGVASVKIDAASHTLTVTFDPHFGSRKSIENAVKGSGYPEETSPAS